MGQVMQSTRHSLCMRRPPNWRHATARFRRTTHAVASAHHIWPPTLNVFVSTLSPLTSSPGHEQSFVIRSSLCAYRERSIRMRSTSSPRRFRDRREISSIRRDRSLVGDLGILKAASDNRVSSPVCSSPISLDHSRLHSAEVYVQCY